ncbi:MAG TPA: ROK family protein [Pyrinomonadaceae bacterium]|nr:ROK family protein [Pyrinomonadaceae bacterium]
MAVKKKEGAGGRGLVIASDLGGTNLRAAAIDETGRIVERYKQNTPKAETSGEMLSAFVTAARDLMNRRSLAGAPIRELAIAVPGTVNAFEGVVMRAPNVPCLDGFRLAAALEEELSIPAILENDANAAAVGEMWQGAAREHKSIICLTLGTGVGGGIILDGELWRGIDGTAAEIGHMVVEPNGQPCACGGRGCLEIYASATAIVRMTREMRPRYPNSPLHTAEDLTAANIYRRGLEGDELAREVFRRVGFYLGVGMTSLINLLNPEMIVIGGGAAAGWDLFYDHAIEQVNSRAFAVPARRARIVQAVCGDDAGLLGVAHLAFTAWQKSSDK